MYLECDIVVRCISGESSKFRVDVGLHQGSEIRPFLFITVTDLFLVEKVRKQVPESIMFADDFVLCGSNEVDVTEYYL